MHSGLNCCATPMIPTDLLCREVDRIESGLRVGFMLCEQRI